MECIPRRFYAYGCEVRVTKMTYDRGLSERLEAIVGGGAGIARRKMFGGVGWLLKGNMVAGVHKDFLIVRVGETRAPLLANENVRPMDITGKVMKGWLMISPPGYEDDADLRRYVETALAFATTLPPKE